MTIEYLSEPLQQRSIEIKFDDANLTDSRFIATVPLGGYITVCRAVIITPFNATGNDLLRIGIGSGGSSLGINLDMSQAAGTIVDRVVAALTASPQTANRDMYATYSYTGDAPTTGRVIVELAWY